LCNNVFLMEITVFTYNCTELGIMARFHDPPFYVQLYGVTDDYEITRSWVQRTGTSTSSEFYLRAYLKELGDWVSHGRIQSMTSLVSGTQVLEVGTFEESLVGGEATSSNVDSSIAEARDK
jgi:hypothetical protein